MGKVGLIIKREYSSRVKKKSFIIMTILGPLIMASVFFAAIWISLQEGGTQHVLVVDTTPGALFRNQLQDSEQIFFDYRTADISDKEFKESNYSLLLYLNEKIFEVNSGDLFYKELPSFKTQNYIRGQLETTIEKYKLAVNNIPLKVYTHINTKFQIFTRDIDQKTINNYTKELSLVGYFFAFLIYMFIFMYGVQVMRGVIEEKTSRIVEVLISSVKPFQLMMGKIIGIALVGLTQFALWVILTASSVAILQNTVLNKKMGPKALIENQITQNVVANDLADVDSAMSTDTMYILDLIERINFPMLIGMFIFYFLGGYLLYAALFASIGAAVDNETDTQQFMMPVTVPLIFAIIVGQFAIQNPTGPASVWFSIIPLTSPIVMMLRVAIGIGPDEIWQLFLSMAILIASFVGTTYLAAKIYRTGILMYGKKVSYKELFKWMFHK